MIDDPNLHPGRAARVSSPERIAGRVGEVHPAVIEDLDLRAGRIIVAELAVAGFQAASPRPLASRRRRASRSWSVTWP